MTLLIGDATEDYTANAGQGFSAGYERAFIFTAIATGTLDTLALRSSSSSTATSLELGVYADSGGVPGALLGSGTVAGPFDASLWVQVSGLSIAIVNGTEYHLAVLALGGTFYWDGGPAGGQRLVDENSTAVLKNPWSTASNSSSMVGRLGFQGLTEALPIEEVGAHAGEPAYEVRITPLLDSDPGAENYQIDKADTDLIEQFSDVDVTHPLNGGKTGSVVLSTADPSTAFLEPWQQALWIGMIRAGNTEAEEIFHAPCNVITDYDAGTVKLVGSTHEKLQHHYVVQGDTALSATTDDPETGVITWDGDGIAVLIDAAQNTSAQITRNMPDLGIIMGTDTSTSHPFYAMGIERGQEVYALIQSVTSSAVGPDLDWRSPADGWPINFYCYLNVADTIGRDLTPADVDDVQPGEVLLGYGYPEDNLEAFTETPGRPTTHAHFLDADRQFRKTAAHIESSALVGAWVDFVQADLTVPTEAAAALLLEMAKARVNAYGEPPKFFEVTLRPDAVLEYLYGHPTWADDYPDGDGQTNGRIYPGDTVYLRAKRDFREYAGPARITEIRLTRPGSNGLSQMILKMVPVVDGVDLDEEEQG